MTSGRFQKGQSGNPAGRPRKRRPDVSAFDIIFDKRLTITQGATARELTVDEALQLQTYQAALAGSKMAIRKVLKMIEKRESALACRTPHKSKPISVRVHHSADNANEAMKVLDIAREDPGMEGKRFLLNTWATQAALSRPGRRRLEEKDTKNIKFFTVDSEKLRWPRGLVE